MPQLEFIQELPRQVPSELMIYPTIRPRAGRNVVVETFKKLDLYELPVQPEVRRAVPIRPEFRYVDRWTIGKHGGYTVAINSNSGAIRLRDEVRHGQELDVKFEISERRLTNISRTFLEKTELLRIPATEAKVAKITYMRAQGASTNGDVTDEQILDAGVIFSREIDGIPVRGFGGYLMVNIAPNESVVASEKIWRHRDKGLGTVKVLAPDYAIEQFQKRLSVHDLENTIKVLKADFCYFEAGDNATQRYLEPTYAFLFEVKVGDFLYKSVEVIPATRTPKQKWAFRKRFVAPEVAREG